MVTIPYNGKKYTLEFTRRSAAALERSGFMVEDIYQKPFTTILRFFNAAFQANHKGLPQEKTDEIWDTLGKRDELLEALANMYVETMQTLMTKAEDDPENAGWEKG